MKERVSTSRALPLMLLLLVPEWDLKNKNTLKLLRIQIRQHYI